MDLRHLEFVVAIVDHGGVGRAATALHVAQPSVSASVRRLERELGVNLFDRIGRRLVLTDAGAMVVEHGRHLLAGRERLQAELADHKDVLVGTLRLVSLPTLATEPLTALVVAFSTRHSAVRVEIAEPVDADDLERRVSDGRSELGITDLALTSRALRRTHLIDQPIVAVLPPATRLPAGALETAALADLPLITTPPGTSSRTLLDQALRRRRLAPNIVVETGHREAIVPLVLSGIGATVLPAALATDAAQRGAIVAELEPPLRRRIGLVHRPGTLSPAGHAFRQLAMDSRQDRS
jgi:DNA-binding transcriptional LysR family regulator